MSIFSDFIQRCESQPEQIAFIQEQRCISYQAFKQQAGRICAILSAVSQPCQRAAVVLDRGIDAAAAIYGIVFSGACYVPLNDQDPPERLRYITEDAKVQFIIGRGQCPKWVNNRIVWLDIDELLQTQQVQQAPIEVGAESLAAILYTSGSTGTPKGVALSHRALLNFSTWAENTFAISTQDHIASLTPFHFDLSIFDLFTSLTSGACVHFVPGNLTYSPSRLTTWLQTNDITAWYTVPSILNFVALKGALTSTPLPKLKTILFAGEVFPTDKLIKLATLLPHVALFNLYGPTETNVCCYWPVDRKRLQIDQPIPIGIPACGASLQIAELTNELLVKSDNNLTGYWQKGSLLEETVSTWYHTGDKVSLNQHGEYCYHGRLDRMLKCSGYRVEPAEIEWVINQLPGIQSCAVVGVNDSTSGQRPAAAVVTQGVFQATDLVKLLRQKLPAYMQPCKIIPLHKLPYLRNGKIDYQEVEKIMQSNTH